MDSVPNVTPQAVVPAGKPTLNLPPKLIYTLNEIAAVTPFSVRKLRAYVACGELPSYKIGDHRVVRHEAYVAFASKPHPSPADCRRKRTA